MNYLHHLIDFLLDETVLRMVRRPHGMVEKLLGPNQFATTPIASLAERLHMGENPMSEDGDEHERRQSSLPPHETSPAAAPDTRIAVATTETGGGGGGGRRGAPGLLKLPREKPRPSAHELLPPDPRRGSVAPRMAGMAATAGRGRRRQGGGAAAVGGGEDGRK